MARINQKIVAQGCQVCQGSFDDEEYLVDGATKYGPWAYMCTSCHESVGKGLGVGRGQKYSVKTLEKVEG